MAESTIWWLLAGALVAVELLSGTFYFLMLSMGPVVAALLAHAGVSVTVQLLAAAAVGGGLVVVWRSYKKASPALPASANHDVNLDVGETVHVDAWNPDGTSSVKYRGVNWSVALADGETPATGAYRIVEVVGSRLLVRKL